MPIYEYRCTNCRKRVTLLLRSFSQPLAPVCDRCHSTNLERLFSRFAVLGSADSDPDDGLDDMGMDMGELEEAGEDPRKAARLLRRMKGEAGEELGPEFDQMVDRLEAGQLPEDLDEDANEAGHSQDDLEGGDDKV